MMTMGAATLDMMLANATVMNAWVAAGLSVESPDDDGRTLLMHACGRGHAEEVTRLVAAGADVNHRDALLYRPLDLSVAGGHVEIARILLAAGARIIEPAADSDEMSTLEVWASRGGRENDEAMFRLLRSHGARVTARVRRHRGDALDALLAREAYR